MRRRSFLAGSVATGGLITIGLRTGLPVGRPASAAAAGVGFSHGVASGDPVPDGVLLWTRVTPTAAAQPGSGVGPDTPVGWEVASDAAFSTVVASGATTATAAADHTVKVDVTGLCPDTVHWYRFTSGGVTSPVGLTRTAPAGDADPGALRFGLVSCSNWAAGFFAAYAQLAARPDVDWIIHLGDYLYEYGTGQYGGVRDPDPAVEMVTLADVRRRHAQYKTDPDLAELHRTKAFICTWDDHEITNDTWRDGAENHQPDEGPWPVRAAAARQAYFEWMPVRRPDPSTFRIHRRFAFGDLAELTMLDLRQYRDEQPSSPADQPTINDPDRTMLGPDQRTWFLDEVGSSGATWSLLGSSVMLTPVTFVGVTDLPGTPAAVDAVVAPVANEAITGLPGGVVPAGGVPYNVDQWDGYAVEQQQVLQALADLPQPNVVSLVGDIHSSWACELRTADAEPVGVELVCTSVTSDNVDDIVLEALAGTPLPPGSPGVDVLATAGAIAVEQAVDGANDAVRMVELRGHGYSVLEVARDAVQMDWFFVDRLDATSASTWYRSWRTPSGTGTLEELGSPLPIDPVRAGGADCVTPPPPPTTTDSVPASTDSVPASSDPVPGSSSTDPGRGSVGAGATGPGSSSGAGGDPASSSDDRSGALARTGPDLVLPLSLGAGAVVAGAGLAWAARRHEDEAVASASASACEEV